MLDPDFLSYHLDLSPQVHTNIGYRGLSIGVSHPTLIPHVGSEKGGPPPNGWRYKCFPLQFIHLIERKNQPI